MKLGVFTMCRLAYKKKKDIPCIPYFLTTVCDYVVYVHHKINEPLGVILVIK